MLKDAQRMTPFALWFGVAPPNNCHIPIVRVESEGWNRAPSKAPFSIRVTGSPRILAQTFQSAREVKPPSFGRLDFESRFGSFGFHDFFTINRNPNVSWGTRRSLRHFGCGMPGIFVAHVFPTSHKRVGRVEFRGPPQNRWFPFGFSVKNHQKKGYPRPQPSARPSPTSSPQLQNQLSTPPHPHPGVSHCEANPPNPASGCEDFFKQSSTRLNFIIDRNVEMVMEIFAKPRRNRGFSRTARCNLHLFPLFFVLVPS